MTGGTPSTPVKVPSSAASYTPATLDPDLRSQINTLLIRDGHVIKIQDQLLHSLHAHPTNWPTTIQSHALSLLRSGEVTTFPALLRRVLDDVRQDTALGGGLHVSDPTGSATNNNNSSSSSSPSSDAVNGSAAAENSNSNNGTKVNGEAKGAGAGDGEKAEAASGSGNGNGSGSGSGGSSLAIPQAAIEDALRVTRESLEAVCEIEENGAT